MKEKKMKKAPAPKKNGYSRIQSFTDAIKSKRSGKVDALIALADQKYVAKGGKSNVREATTVCGFGLKVLEGMNIVSLEGENYKLN